MVELATDLLFGLFYWEGRGPAAAYQIHFKEYMVNKGNDSVFHLRNIRDEGMYWIFGYIRETIVQLDNTP